MSANAVDRLPKDAVETDNFSTNDEIDSFDFLFTNFIALKISIPE